MTVKTGMVYSDCTAILAHCVAAVATVHIGNVTAQPCIAPGILLQPAVEDMKFTLCIQRYQNSTTLALSS